MLINSKQFGNKFVASSLSIVLETQDKIVSTCHGLMTFYLEQGILSLYRPLLKRKYFLMYHLSLTNQKLA